MNQRFRFFVDPTPKQRPRFTRGHAWTPPKTRMAQDALADMLRDEGAALHEKGTPVWLRLIFGVEPPKSAGKAPTKRPDIDQYVKLVMDAANGILYEDDAQVVDLQACKVYATKPFIEIQVGEHSDLTSVWSIDPVLAGMQPAGG